jgi:extracellular factor (EF) 3-hydroxypalmitic acid methyl ester biosynthesis protein
VLNLGCGPAREIQEFLVGDAICDQVQFTLLDFNNETIEHTASVLEDLKRKHGRRTQFQLQKKSVHQLLKEGNKPTVTSVSGLASAAKYDFIYCAGLIDYLSDRTCKQLMNVLLDWLAPGGLIATTHVDDSKPFRNMLEFVLDWHINYRDAKASLSLLPERLTADCSHVEKDSTEVNVFIETRKPEHA